jgi:hypothetical protein
MSDSLQEIQTLQFTDRGRAEALLRDFIGQTFSFDVARVTLRPQAVSLNSFNGFVELADGTEYFFKTHSEQDNVIDEYYNAAMLARAGYPVIEPVYSSTRAGQHLLIYERIDAPSVFDLARDIENGRGGDLKALTTAQNAADDLLLALYRQSIETIAATDNAKAPIYQLFYHRLTGGRLARFYGSGQGEWPVVDLPGGTHSMHDVRKVRWVINDQVYDPTLDDLIGHAIDVLNPDSPCEVSVIGHGDAHNGNVFYTDSGLVYFDPAFAGRHNFLLDVVKPLFHNVFAMWMYFPQEKRTVTPINLDDSGGKWHVTYDYDLHPVRHMFLTSKVERVLIPALRMLRNAGTLPPDWRAILKAGLFCCPFLTLNLADGERFPPEIALLGLAMSVEMGAESSGKRSLIDQVLDDVATCIMP